jgi:hypothetical protein
MTIRGFRVATIGANALDGINCNGGTLWVGNCRFGPCGRGHLFSGGNTGNIQVIDQTTITIESAGNCAYHLGASAGGSIQVINPPSPVFPALNILGPVSMPGGFVNSTLGSFTQVAYNSITGGGNVSGPKYSASLNGIISSLGGGTSYYPGNSAGSISTGGQYV